MGFFFFFFFLIFFLVFYIQCKTKQNKTESKRSPMILSRDGKRVIESQFQSQSQFKPVQSNLSPIQSNNDPNLIQG